MTRKIETINYSEFATLSQCETKWGYGYMLAQEETGEKRGLHKGTLLHLGWGRWLAGDGFTLPEVWTDDINTGGKPGEERTLSLSDFDPSIVAEVLWLARRFEEHYGSVPPSSWNVISTEGWLTGSFKIGARKVRIVGRTDALVEVEGLLYLAEVKSFGRKDRMTTIGIEPQPTIYYDLVEQTYGRAPDGIMYEGIYTHQYATKKPTQAEISAEVYPDGFPLPEFPTKASQRDWARAAVEAHPGVERPVADSFIRDWIDRTPQAIEVGHQYLGNAIKRRDRIKSIEDTIPNVGNACSWCGFKDQCWERLTGVPQYVELEFVENEGEPV